MILYEHTNSISFTNVEVFRRNNDIGPQQHGLIKFIKWSELTFEYSKNTNEVAINSENSKQNSDEGPKSYSSKKPEPVSSTVGLTEDGRIFHVIRFNERTIARLLSGTDKYADFQLSNKGRLISWNEKGESFFYSANLWMTSPKKLIYKRWLKLWGYTSAGAIGLKMILLGDYYFPMEILGYNFNFPMLELFFSSATAMSSGFAMLSRYEHENTYPNGFTRTPETLNTFDWISNPKYLTFFKDNLENFEPPDLDILDPKLDTEFTEDIR